MEGRCPYPPPHGIIAGYTDGSLEALNGQPRLACCVFFQVPPAAEGAISDCNLQLAHEMCQSRPRCRHDPKTAL